MAGVRLGPDRSVDSAWPNPAHEHSYLQGLRFLLEIIPIISDKGKMFYLGGILSVLVGKQYGHSNPFW